MVANFPRMTTRTGNRGLELIPNVLPGDIGIL
jgi:hypothetical protein